LVSKCLSLGENQDKIFTIAMTREFLSAKESAESKN
jgi:hypothetical protein